MTEKQNLKFVAVHRNVVFITLETINRPVL